MSRRTLVTVLTTYVAFWVGDYIVAFVAAKVVKMLHTSEDYVIMDNKNREVFDSPATRGIFNQYSKWWLPLALATLITIGLHEFTS